MKVGKAIYNILSQSTDVQSNFPFNNTDYSPTGTELVTNGDFSAAGINLVDNPNFTDTGSDLIVNGIFDTTIPMNSAGSGWFTSTTALFNNVGGVDGLKIPRTTSSAYGVALKVDNSNLLTANTSYKISYEVLENNGSGGVYILAGAGTAVNGAITTGVTHTIYITSGASDYLRFYNQTNNSDYTITNVTCEELGADWTVVDGAGTVTFGDSFAEITKTSVNPSVYLSQDYAVTLGASHKLTYTITENTFTGSGTELGLSGAGAYGSAVLDATASATPKTVYLTVTDDTPSIAALRFYSQGDGGSIKITNISVQELGEGWTLQSGWSVGDSKASYDAVTNARNIKQLLNFELGKSYKIQFTTSTGTAKLKFTNQLGTQLFTDIGIDEYAPNSYELYGTAIASTELRIYAYNTGGGEAFSITNISVEELDPNDYWTLGTGWSIGADKAISTVTSSNSDITQSILTAGKTYRTVFEVVDYTDGTVQAVVTGSEGADRRGIGTYTEDLTATGSNFSIRSKLGTFDGAVTRVSVDILNSGDVNLSLTNQLTEKVTNVVLTPILTNGRYTEFSYQPTDLIEGMYLLKFTGDTITYAETLAYITTGTPPLGESSYTEYTTGDDNPDHVYIP